MALSYYHMKSKTFSCLIPTIESPSLPPNIQKTKNISVTVLYTYLQIKWRFPILSLKVDNLSTFVIKPNFNIICYCVYLGLLEIEMTSWSHYTFTFLIDMLHCYHIIIPNQVDVKLRGCCTSYQKLACFVLYRKLINNFLKNKLCNL